MLTSNEILNLKVGDKIQHNYSVHYKSGPNPNTWGRPMTIISINYRGVTADCHPLGAGHPFVCFDCQFDEEQGRSAWSCSVGVDTSSIRIYDINEI